LNKKEKAFVYVGIAENELVKRAEAPGGVWCVGSGIVCMMETEKGERPRVAAKVRKKLRGLGVWRETIRMVDPDQGNRRSNLFGGSVKRDTS